MALVRVYCGLALAESTARSASAGPALTAAVVDDAGRLIHVCEISDDPAGYARLGALLADRSSGPSGVAVAADSDDHVVVSLLSAAGRPLAIADDDSVDDFAERFADDESLEEMQSPPAERRAVGLARALQAGALSAVMLPPPRDLGAYKPVLAAHAALASGRHSAAVALREVLRELYPAALRAYPDPAEPVSLAVLDALPEPGMLAGFGNRRETSVAAEAIVSHLAGIAEPAAIGDAVTALRVAVAETPRRAPVSEGVTAAAAETVRHAVAAVRACDAGCDALVAALAERLSSPAPAAAPTRAGRRAALVEPSSPPVAAERRSQPRQPEHEPVPVVGRRRQLTPAGGTNLPTSPRPVSPPPVAPAPVTPAPLAPRPVAPAAYANPAGSGSSALPSRPSPKRAAEPSAAPGLPHRTDPSNRPVSAPPPPPPGITPTPPSQRGSRPPAEAGEPFRATLTTAAINSARAERQRPTPIPPRPKTRQDEPAPPTSNGFGATDLSLPMPAARPAPEPPGSRANWPLVNSAEDLPDRGSAPGRSPHPFDDREQGAGRRPANGSTADSRVTPPWLADDLPQEPPMLRLVEPPPLADRALREDVRRPEPVDETPPLRLVERKTERPELVTRSRRAVDDTPPELPVSDGDGDLLIFAAARSAWFTGQDDESEAEIEWVSTADTGWRAAEQAARPAVGMETRAGLPKRVPQANLVPGSPLREERPLQIVRNAASMAENTTGYFRGWRRGQEIGGYAVGGRPGREAAGGWDFSRDPGEPEELDYEYGSAGYRR